MPIYMRNPHSPEKNRPIFIIEGKAYRLRSAQLEQIASAYKLGPNWEQRLDELDPVVPSRFNMHITLTTTSGETVEGEYARISTGMRPSGRQVWTLSNETVSETLHPSAESRAEYIKRQADFVRGLIAESTLFDEPVNMDDPDEVLVAAFCCAGVMDLSDAPADQHNNTI